MLEARNAGKPIADARGEMAMVVDTFRYYAGAPERLLGDTIPVAGGQAFTVREPLGVVGLITPWNFPLTIASLEARAGARRRQHGRAQAGRADAADRAALRRARARGRAAATGVVNVVVGPGRTCGAAPRRAPRRREDRLHRLDRGRALDRRGRRADDQARDARARRQVGQRDLRRRRPRGGRRRRAAGGVRQRRPGLLRALADPRAGATRSSASWSCSSAAVEGAARRRPARRGHADGPADLRRPARERRLVPRRTGARSPSAAARPEGAGFWFAPTVLCPVEPERPRRARGGLRPDRRRDPVRRRGGGGPRWPTTRSTACRARSGRATARARCASRGRSRPGCCRSTRTPRCA